MGQFLNRALVLLSDPLQPVLHPVTRVFTVSIVTAVAIGSALRPISLVHVLVVAAPLRIVVTRLTADEGGLVLLLRVSAAILLLIENLVVAFPEIGVHFLNRAALTRAMRRRRLRIVAAGNVGG